MDAEIFTRLSFTITWIQPSFVQLSARGQFLPITRFFYGRRIVWVSFVDDNTDSAVFCRVILVLKILFTY